MSMANCMRSYANHRMLAGVTEEPVRLILGNSSTGESYWNGNLTGFAIYNRALTADQVSRNYEAWKGETPSPTAAVDGCLAIYPFTERKGTTVHNTINASGNLTIPERFKPVQRKILSPFMVEYKWNLSFAQDTATNILGFIPFGFFFSALLLKNTHMKGLPVYLIVAILGTMISFAIELTQAYLPTRDSSLTDVVMNVAGTMMGIITFQILYRSRPSSVADR